MRQLCRYRHGSEVSGAGSLLRQGAGKSACDGGGVGDCGAYHDCVRPQVQAVGSILGRANPAFCQNRYRAQRHEL